MDNETEATVRERRIRFTLEANGVNADATTSGLHSWRCEHPDRYGPCDCFDSLVADLTHAATCTCGEHPEDPSGCYCENDPEGFASLGTETCHSVMHRVLREATEAPTRE